MECIQASGDYSDVSNTPPRPENNEPRNQGDAVDTTEHSVDDPRTSEAANSEDCEKNLQNRISQCRSIIEALREELIEEKSKLERESKPNPATFEEPPLDCINLQYSDYPKPDITDLSLPYGSGLLSTSVNRKLGCDESLMEYEKQLQKYQNTLNMAQIEKKNAIRKQMLAKAYKLKLLEVENQCNIELLRVKQSLQCLEPLQLIANGWKIPNPEDSLYDCNNFELMPRFPELRSSSDGGSLKDEEKVDIKNITELKVDANIL